MNANCSGTIDAVPNIRDYVDHFGRTNEQWLEELAGRCTPTEQQRTHELLSSYLHRVAITYLYKRRGDVPLLRALNGEELAQFAQDFVQEVLEKLARDDFALLDKFSKRGRFLSWMTQILHRSISSELRLAAWKTRISQPSEEVLLAFIDQSSGPEFSTLVGEVGEILEWALDQLPEHYRVAFWERVVEHRSADEVGAMLDISANAVYILVHRAKEKLLGYLTEVEITPEVLVWFN